MNHQRFQTRQTSFWDALESDITETDEEAADYDAQVVQAIAWKVDLSPRIACRPCTSSSGDKHHVLPAAVQQQVAGTALQDSPLRGDFGSATQPRSNRNVNSDANPQAHPALESISLAPQRQIPALPTVSRLRSGKSLSTPTLSRLTGHTTIPSVPTPKDFSTPLPPPAKRANQLQWQASVHTPDAIASPIDTPDHTLALRSNVQTPPVPVPLGSEPHASIKGKKEYLKLTEHFADFSRTVSKDAEASTIAVAPLKGRAKGKSVGRMVQGLGGRVFNGLRFCIPPELGPVTKHKQRWEVITKLGGQVTLQPDTATTHVVYDKTSASMLARELGLRSINDLPEGTICVRWSWIVACKLAGALVDSTAYNSFPRTTFTRTQSAGAQVPNLLFRPSGLVNGKAIEAVGVLRGNSISISRKREHTASDSDTESPRKPRNLHTTKSAILPLKAVSAPRITAGPSRLSMVSTIATSHALPSGPGWEITPQGEQDGLDEMISGVVNGTVDQRALSEIAEDDNEERDDIPGDSDPHADAFRCGQKNAGVVQTGPNEWLAKKFDDMHDMYQGVQGKNAFAIRQYMQAASILRRTLYPVRSGAEARKIKGVGHGMADRIDEFISGAPGRLFYEDNEQARAIATFKDIYGVGRTFANELYKRGARTMNDLRTKDYGLTSGQLIGVELYDDLNARISREECRQLYEIIRAEAVAIDPKVWIEIMGSYRRGQETSGDVDILITRDTADGLNHSGVIKKLVDRLQMRGIITHDLSMPHDWRALEAKWMGVGRLDANSKHRRIDILCIPFEQWGAALIYFTGNEIFNRSLRLYARKKGYSLNQRGLSAGVIRDKQGQKMTEGNIIASRTEQDIFDVLGLRWRHPHHRRP